MATRVFLSRHVLYAVKHIKYTASIKQVDYGMNQKTQETRLLEEIQGPLGERHKR